VCYHHPKMRVAIISLLLVAIAAVVTPSCVIGGDEPWDAEGSDTDTDIDGDSDSDTGTDTDVDYGDGGPDGGADAG
jgi:hypothetical protein